MEKFQEVCIEDEKSSQQLTDYLPQLSCNANSASWIYWFNYSGRKSEQMRDWGLQTTLSTSESLEMVCPLHGVNSVCGPFWNRTNSIKDVQDQAVRWFNPNTYISELLNRESHLKESEERLRLMVDASPSFMWMLDQYGAPIYLNKHGLEFLGVTLEEFVESGGWQGNVHPDDVELVTQALLYSIEIRTRYRLEHRIKAVSGEYRWVLSTGNLAISDSGETYGFVGSSVDITERKGGEEVLKDYAAKLEQSNQALEQFATIASHDLQEPLRKVRAFSEILAGVVPSDYQEYAERLKSAGIRMQNLIDDLLMFSQIKRKEKKFQQVDLNRVVQQVLEDLELMMRDVGVQIWVAPLATIYADESQIRQLLQNLISNGLKYHTEERSPILHIEGEYINQGKFFKVVVKDNGIGLKPEYYKQIFEPFQRLHGVGKYPGTGMGLSICRKIVERHHGTITVESELGKGSKFSFAVPVGDNQ